MIICTIGQCDIDFYHDNANDFIDDLFGLTTKTAVDYSKMDTFLDDLATKYYASMIRFDNSGMPTFTMTIMFSKRSNQWMVKNSQYAELREKLRPYQNIFDATLWEVEGMWSDIMAIAIPLTARTICATLLCMIGICFLFMRNIFCTIISAASIASITTILIGTMISLGGYLDSAFTVNMIVGVGFAVDYTAHIVHIYRTSANGLFNTEQSIEYQRLYSTLSVSAWPAIQASITTIITVLPVVFYSVRTHQFLSKTFIFVVLIGLAHATIILPTLLVSLPQHITGYRNTASRRDSKATDNKATDDNMTSVELKLITHDCIEENTVI